MPFKAIIQELMEATPGANGAILADWEGEAVVQQCSYDDYELKVIGAHGGILLGMIKDLHGAGNLTETTITMKNLQIVLGPIGPDYSLIMTLGRDALLGRALFNFRRAVERMTKEIY